MIGYNGDSISDSEWFAAEEQDIEAEQKEKSLGDCPFCGEDMGQYGQCVNGCYSKVNL